MSAEWREFKIGDLCNVTSSKRIFAHDYVGSGIPFYSSKDVIDKALGSFSSIEVFISEKRFSDIATKYSYPQKGDLLLSSVGNRAGVAYVVQDEGEFYFKDGNITWFKDFKRINSNFLCYWLKSSLGQSALNSIMIGSAQKALTISGLSKLNIAIPPFEIQNCIVAILKALDDRIALLHETNATLEAVAQALFKSWFVDFNPVHARQQGIAPEGMDEATAALFPDGFEESELGLVPKGWRVGTIEDLCDVITNGGTPSRSKSEFWEGGSIPWFKTGDFNDGFLLTPSERITDDALKNSSAKLLPENAVLMAIYAAPTVGRLGILTEPATFNQACTGMIAKTEIGTWFLYWTLFSGRVWFNSRANGAAQQNISKSIVASYKTIVPPPEVLASFSNVTDALYSRIRTCSEKAQTLATLRDTLLPRLISGQLRLPEAEAMREAVAG